MGRTYTYAAVCEQECGHATWDMGHDTVDMGHGLCYCFPMQLPAGKFVPSRDSGHSLQLGLLGVWDRRRRNMKYSGVSFQICLLMAK